MKPSLIPTINMRSPITLSMANRTSFRSDSNLAEKMVQTRLLSNLSGPDDKQNQVDSYLPTRNSHHTLAWRDGALVGYILAKSYDTGPTLGTKCYSSPAQATLHAGDTLTVNEIVVQSSEQGQGIASKMLDFIVRQDNMAQIKDVEFSVLASNLASELMFTRFAERHVKMSSKTDLTSHLQQLEIHSPVYETLALLGQGRWQSYNDRQALVKRARVNQDRRI
ncbi:hypothetical protein BJ741DRAFT_176084 [Chytriomyces cf. hyalinus JEL632]|nr:hypothetical protein BJ741DRAFT_176084 [Chytriomyces cf. hyalinus JEL632]